MSFIKPAIPTAVYKTYQYYYYYSPLNFSILRAYKREIRYYAEKYIYNIIGVYTNALHKNDSMEYGQKPTR